MEKLSDERLDELIGEAREACIVVLQWPQRQDEDNVVPGVLLPVLTELKELRAMVRYWEGTIDLQLKEFRTRLTKV